MFKKIVGFGDSWMYGDELTDPNNFITEPHARGLCNSAYRERNCFLGQLGAHYNVPTENFGIMGGSLQSAIWTFLYWLEREPNPADCLVLHGLTESYRISYYNPGHQVYPNDPPWNRFVHSAWPPECSPEFRDLIKYQLTLTSSRELRKLNYQQAVLFFDGQASRHHIPLLQFNVFNPDTKILDAPTLALPDVDLQSWLRQQGKEYLKPHRHPNEIGHQKIAQLLINCIDHVIITT